MRSIRRVASALSQSHQDDVILASVNAFLINTGSRLILVDAGYTPEQADEVEITHMHMDHLGGIAQEGKAVFPHAVVRMDQRDADYWLNLDHAKNASAQMKDMFANAIVALAPYKATGRFKPFQGKTELAPGVQAVPAYGHTPGHTVYSIESKGQRLLLVGDLLHIEAVVQRKKIFKAAAEEGYLLGAAHLPFPGSGHVLKAKPGYRYLPLPYAPVQ